MPAQTGANPLTGASRRDSRRLGPKPGPDEEVPEWMLEDESLFTLESVAPEPKARFLYTYDLGDSWDHVVLVEKILPAEPNGVYPLCVTGKRNGPIEDCGGSWGYDELLEILADPSHPDHEERKEWLEDVYGVSTWDGDAFDLDEINARLRELPAK